MPTYDYRCSACAEEFEFFGRFEESPEGCPGCGGQDLKRKFPSPHFSMKGKKVTRLQKNPRVLGGSGQARRTFVPGYKSALARFPGDPFSWAGSKAEAERKAKALGREIHYDFSDAYPPSTDEGG